ncbi:hypothetical protein ACFYWN_15845 [Streptomyces sp. NPDC002917]|uniref:cytochrome P450 n=1 Tax=Streptomyces sp. NPDC002917 TaxID=3364671 RepID=UPI00367D3440
MPSVTDRYDPLATETLRNPYSVLAELRAREPVFWHAGMGSWVLTRYADCVRVLRDHETFARDPRRTGGTVPEPSLSVQTLDPPQQNAVRSSFMTALRAQDLTGIEGRARHLVGERLDQLAGAGPFDAVSEIAVPLSVAVVADLLGVEPPPYGEFAAVSDAIMRSMDGGLDPALVEPGRIARGQLSELVDSWFAASSRPGLLARVRQATVADSDALARSYVKNTARVMFQGGYSTMAAAVGNAVHTLLTHPGTLERMRDRALLATGVDELVRFDGPVQGTTRTTPVGSSWINQIETWFGLLTRQSIRRSTFASVNVLIKQIRDYIDSWNSEAKPFTWTATAEEILAKVRLVQTNIKKLVANNSK